MTIVYITESY